ncbi:MAG: hypothetical protein OEY49_12645 [Candidatus Heimdallarchaeota archaeon]|nr:hypothetical protein [Candidatus Heimdallarchaeota archaeon]
MKPIAHIRNEGKCDACIARATTIRRAGNFCDHCNKSAATEMIYANRKTKKLYCVDCRAIFRMSLIDRGFTPEDATKIMIQDFILVNDPMQKKKIHGRNK